jgi:hypothetical protein
LDNIVKSTRKEILETDSELDHKALSASGLVETNKEVSSL